MKRIVFEFILGIAILVGLYKYFTTYTPSIPEVSVIATPAAFVLPSAMADNSVEITDTAMVPNEISVESGQSVTFKVIGKNPHDIEKGRGNAEGQNHEHFDESTGSGELSNGQTFTLKLAIPGVVYYHDHLNPDIFVKITVL
jgi:plastocyanin